MAIFTWLLDYPGKLPRKPRVLEASFGDGYIQVAGDGLNANLEAWSVQASGIPAEIGKAIDDFLSGLGGYTYFQWTAPIPSAVQKNYICKLWDITYINEDEVNFTATFTEWPTLA